MSGVLAISTELVLWAVYGDQSTSTAATSNMWIVTVFLALIGGYLGLLALFGFYARQAAESGALELASFTIASLGMILINGFVWTGAFVSPALAESAPEFLGVVDASPPVTQAIGTLSAFVLFTLG